MWFRIISLLWSSILFFVETALARSGMFHFLLCFVFFASLFAYVCSGILYGHYGMFLPTFLLRFVLFCWLVCACPVPAFFTVAPACCFYWHVFCTFLFRHVFFFACFGMFDFGMFTHVMFRHVKWSIRHVIFSGMFSFASFVLLACLRMSCSGMFYGRSGMFYFPTCFLHVSLPACFFVPRVSECLILACLSTFFFRPAAFHTLAARCWSCLQVVATTGRAQLRLSNAVQRRHDRFYFLHADFHHVVLVVLFWSLWPN